VLSEVGFAGWGWCHWSPVEGAVCPFDLGLHDGRHRFDPGLPDISWKVSIVNSSPIGTIWSCVLCRWISAELDAGEGLAYIKIKIILSQWLLENMQKLLMLHYLLVDLSGLCLNLKFNKENFSWF
jgi:hypothetical protein